MNRIYQGRVTKVEILNGKSADGQPQWRLLGFTPEEAEGLEKERECLRPLTKADSLEGQKARKRLAQILRGRGRARARVRERTRARRPPNSSVTSIAPVSQSSITAFRPPAARALLALRSRLVVRTAP